MTKYVMSLRTSLEQA